MRVIGIVTRDVGDGLALARPAIDEARCPRIAAGEQGLAGVHRESPLPGVTRMALAVVHSQDRHHVVREVDGPRIGCGEGHREDHQPTQHGHQGPPTEPIGLLFDNIHQPASPAGLNSARQYSQSLRRPKNATTSIARLACSSEALKLRPRARRVTSTGSPASCFGYGSCREMTKFDLIFLI